ncbi:hypothetical protein F2Q70_00030113 [Brassica cretica]|uniref:Uncharacterized protein n=1 Tax=Brassica cretica TaxID=69181 RepID=A0A8S9FL54_BRACR|nr:hypothetical protein F2Q70_00030113 [Brassica cretica]
MTGTRLPDERAQAVRSLGSLLNYVRLDPQKGPLELAAKRLIKTLSGNTKEKIAVRNNAGKKTPAATATTANAYANATVLEKIENLAATFRHRKCIETSSQFLFLNINGNDKSYQTP